MRLRSGKTETTKKAMQYFATLAGGTGVEDQVLEVSCAAVPARRAAEQLSPRDWEAGEVRGVIKILSCEG